MTPRKTLDDEPTGEAEVPRDYEMAREMGEQSADIATLKTEVSALRKDVAEIKQMLATNKGGVKMLLAVGSIAATLGASLAEVIHWWNR
jgi:hypothetical protein